VGLLKDPDQPLDIAIGIGIEIEIEKRPISIAIPIATPTSRFREACPAIQEPDWLESL
jgi:hypothetical protein